MSKKETTLNEYEKMFKKMLCGECGANLKPSKRFMCSGGCRYPMCKNKKCKKNGIPMGYMTY